MTRLSGTPPSASSDSQALAAALRAELHSFHYFELFIGVFVTAVAALVTLWLYQGRSKRQDLREERETAVTLSRDMDVRTLKRVLGGANFPSWMQFPDRERVGWINDLLSQLWPHAATAAAAKVRESLEPALAANKPRWMTDISLHTFTLGDAAPYVAAIKVYKSSDVMEEAIAEVDLVWAGKAKFQLLVKPLPKIPLAMGLDRLLSTFISMRAGVSDLYFSGRLRLALSPLVNHVPVVGALKVSLVSQPEFSYNLSVQGGDITFLPGLEAFINSFVRETVLQPYILPEGYRIPLDGGSAQLEVPKGMVLVRVLAAKHVPWMDWWSKTDPYVQVFVRDQRHRRTRTINNNLKPKWDEHFELLVHHPEHQSVTAVMYDSNMIGRDEEIGRVSVPIEDLPPGETQDLWLDLEPPATRNGVRNPLDAGLQGVRTVQQVVGAAASVTPFVRHHKKRCQLHIQATYYRVGADEVKAASEGANAEEVSDIASRGEHGSSTTNPEVINMLRGGVLYVKVRKPQQALPGTPDLPSKAAQVRISVAGQEKHTAAVDGVDNPDWEEVLDFALGGEVVDDEDAQVHVEAFDYHWVNYSRENLTWGSSLGTQELPGTGKLSIPLQEIIQQRVISNDYQLPDFPAGFVDLELKWLPILE